MGLSCIVSIICTHILLEQSLTYETDFIYSFLTLFVSLVITILTYYSKDQSIIPYSSLLFALSFVNWLIPTLHCFIRYMLDNSSRIQGFYSFYRNNSLVFILFYLGLTIYGILLPNAFQWFYTIPLTFDSGNFIPFNILSTQIEQYIYQQLPLTDIIVYLASRIVIYIPFGFYIYLFTRKNSRILRVLLFLFLPVLFETIQFYYNPSYCDIDDIIFGLIGVILGGLLYLLKNFIYRMFSGKDFLSNDNGYRNSGRPLHF